MTESIKKILYRTLGLKRYLRILHKGFNLIFITGGLRRNYVYKYHYFVKHLIAPDDIVLDIGANLGYYTRIFSNLLSDKGKVLAVEPVKPFYDVIIAEVGKRDNVVVYNHALGIEEKDISLTIPNTYGYIRTGLPQINEDGSQEGGAFHFKSRMVRASKLFGDLPRIDFVKMDIEGYEEHVIPEMIDVLKKHRPKILIETWGTHKVKTFESLLGAGFKPYMLYNGKLTDNLASVKEGGDFLFIHEQKEAVLMDALRQKGLVA